MGEGGSGVGPEVVQQSVPVDGVQAVPATVSAVVDSQPSTNATALSVESSSKAQADAGQTADIALATGSSGEAPQTENPKIVEFRGLLKASDVVIEDLPQEIQTKYKNLRQLAPNMSPQQFATAYLDFMTDYQKMMAHKYPEQAKNLGKALKLVSNGEITADELFKELMKKAEEVKDPEAVKDLETLQNEQRLAKKEGRPVNPNVLKSINFGRLVKFFGIGILIIFGVLLLGGVTSSGAMAAGH